VDERCLEWGKGRGTHRGGRLVIWTKEARRRRYEEGVKDKVVDSCISKMEMEGGHFQNATSREKNDLCELERGKEARGEDKTKRQIAQSSLKEWHMGERLGCPREKYIVDARGCGS